MNFILTVDSKTLNRVIKLKETEQSKTTPTRGCEIQTSFPLSWVNDSRNQNLLTSSRFSLSPEKQSSHHHRHVSQQGIEQSSAIETAISTQPSDFVIFFSLLSSCAITRMNMRDNSSMELENAETDGRDCSVYLRRNGKGMQRGNCRMDEGDRLRIPAIFLRCERELQGHSNVSRGGRLRRDHRSPPLRIQRSR